MRRALCTRRGALTITLSTVVCLLIYAVFPPAAYWVALSNRILDIHFKDQSRSSVDSKPTQDPPSAPQWPPPALLEAVESNGNPPEKAVVMAALPDEDTAWASALAPDWQPHIYVPLPFPNPLNASEIQKKGRESLAYLTHILLYYDHLAATTAFVHSHGAGYPLAWHVDSPGHSNTVVLRRLQTDYVQEKGYVNLRCSWDPGCPAEIKMERGASKQGHTAENAMPAAFKQLLPDMTAPAVLGAPCCAQFAVSRERIRRRSREDYEQMREWILETELDDGVSGRVMEFLWHVIFGQDAVDCPPIGTCYCKLYGICDPVQFGAWMEATSGNDVGNW